MIHDPSEPIDECLKECTAAERKAIVERMPPYDGVRTWHDLLVVRDSSQQVQPFAPILIMKIDERQNDNA